MNHTRTEPAKPAPSTPEDFGELFRLHGNSIFGYCFSRTGDREQAKDLLSMTFLEAWRRRDAAVEPDKEVGWLFGIATNLIRNQKRSERRCRSALDRIAADLPSEDFAERSLHRIDEQREMAEVAGALASLPLRDREIVAMSVWGELSYGEIATALDIPLGTVRSRLSRTKQKLRAAMRPALAEEVQR